MSTQSNSQLTDSWVVNDPDEADISWAEDSDQSEPGHQADSPVIRKGENNATRQYRKSSSVLRDTTSDLIMPSLSDIPVRGEKPVRSPLRSKQQIQVSPSQHQPQPITRTVQSRSTPNRRQKPVVVDDGPSYVLQIVEYFLDILLSALKKLKQPISWALAAYLFAGGLMLLQNLITSSISSALSPICRIPGVSFLHLPICHYTLQASDHPTIQPSSKDASTNPEFDALMTVQSKFDDLLSDSSTSLTLPLDMKRSETSIRDLRQVVRFSTIPSKNELLHEFDGFVETARIASYDLQKFNSHVGRSVDNVLSTARWTQRVLDDISTERSNRGIIPAFFQDTLLAPFQPIQFTEARLLDQYIQHSKIVSDEINRLINEATALLQVLNNLEDRLDVIHGISLRDNIAAQSDRDIILSQLWTFLGGNKAKPNKSTNQINLLSRVGEYRKQAYAHVSGTIVKLQGMGAELEELRQRVGTAEVLRDSGVKGVPLSVHLEAIRLGVERLEGQREKAREVERGFVRRVVDAADDGAAERRFLVEG